MTRSHLLAVSQALFVTFLWSTSWVLIKIGLQDIPALTFAGLRYSLAFLVLLPFLFHNQQFQTVKNLDNNQWLKLIRLGIIMYALTQGAQFLALAYLPAQTTSLLLSFTPVVVALLSMGFLSEYLTRLQWSGVLVYLLGAILFLLPTTLPTEQQIGLFIAVIGVLANASASLLGRSVNRSNELSPFVVTVVSMGVGSLTLLAVGIVTQGLPSLSVQSWLIIVWLALVNTAFAFTLWNVTLRQLTAVESSLINNTMLIQIAILAWLFLGESLNPKEILGLSLAALGVLIVQLSKPTLIRSLDSRQISD